MRIGTYLGSPPLQGGGDPKGGAVDADTYHRGLGARTIHNHPGLRPPLLAKEGSSYACSPFHNQMPGAKSVVDYIPNFTREWYQISYSSVSLSRR